MSLPPKEGPQEWEDVALPGFDPVEAAAPRVRSHKEKDDAANKITWTRYKVSGVQCVDCVIEYPKGLRVGIGAANWLRVQGEDKRALCWMHKSEYLARGDKGLPRGE